VVNFFASLLILPYLPFGFMLKCPIINLKCNDFFGFNTLEKLILMA